MSSKRCVESFLHAIANLEEEWLKRASDDQSAYCFVYDGPIEDI